VRAQSQADVKHKNKADLTLFHKTIKNQNFVVVTDFIMRLKMGMKLTHCGLSKDRKVIPSTEKGIFEALGMEYVPPEERE